MSTIVKVGTGQGYDKRLLIKGASEIVKSCCTHYLNGQGERVELTDEMNAEMDIVINSYAENALRTIVLAYKDIEAGQNGEKHDEPDD